MILFRTNGASVAAALRQIARENPREFPQVLATVGMGLKKKMKAALPKGMMPLRFLAWNSFTTLLRLKLKRKSFSKLYARSGLGLSDIGEGLKVKKNGDFTKGSRRKIERRYKNIGKVRKLQDDFANRGKFGGMLSNTFFYKKPSRESVYVGFRNDKLAQHAQSFQSAENRALTKAERHFRHKIQGKNIDSTYNRPARQIMKPFANDKATQAYIVDVAKKRLQSIISKATATVKPTVAA